MEKPILFSTEMVRAILEGRKTQTRRIIKPQPPEGINSLSGPEWYEPAIIDRYGELKEGKPIYGVYDDSGEFGTKCPRQPGDILWVRETWLKADDGFHYRADETPISKEMREAYGYKWKPSIHMPREAARLFLKVINVRVERLQDITEEDAIAEGVSSRGFMGELLDKKADQWCKYSVIAAESQGRNRPKTADKIGAFAYLWDSINAKRGYGWGVNPWVFVIEFESVKP